MEVQVCKDSFVWVGVESRACIELMNESLKPRKLWEMFNVQSPNQDEMKDIGYSYFLARSAIHSIPTHKPNLLDTTFNRTSTKTSCFLQLQLVRGADLL